MSYRPEGWENPYHITEKALGTEVKFNQYPEFEVFEAGADAMLKALIRKGVSTNSFRPNSNPIYITNPRKNGVYVFIPEEKK